MPQTQTYKFMNESVDVASGIPVVGQSAVVDGPRSNSIPGEAVIGSRGTEVVTARNPFAAGSPITTAPGSGTTTSSSGSFAEAVVNLGNSINSAQTNVPATGFLTPNDVSLANEQKAASQARYEEQRTNLDKQREQAIRELEAQFGRAEQSLGQAHRNETGSSSLGLARIGGFDSASGQAVLTNLATTQRAEMQALMDKRDSAVNAAKNAYDEKQFAAAKALADDVKSIDKEIYDRAKDFANYTLQLRGQARQDAQFQLDTYKEQRQIEKDNFDRKQTLVKFADDHGLTDKPFIRIGNTAYSLDTGSPVTLAEYQKATGQKVGLPESETDFSQLSRVDVVAQNDKEFVTDLRKQYPDAGIQQGDSADEAARKLSNSKIYKDKVRGPVGDTAGIKKQAFLTDVSNGIEEFKQAARAVDPNYDGYIPPDMYRQLRDRAIAVLGSSTAFEAQFPVYRYLAPQNRVQDLFFRNDEQKDEGID